jgi:hypothetical protein
MGIKPDFEKEAPKPPREPIEELERAVKRLDRKEPGKLFPFPLEELIEAIYVNPYVQEWYFEVVKDLVKSLKAALANRVQKSDLASPPWL